MAVSNLAYSNSQACDICNITTYLVLLRILLQLHESTPFLATTQKLIYIKALCRGGGLSNNDGPSSKYTASHHTTPLSLHERRPVRQLPHVRGVRTSGQTTDASGESGEFFHPVMRLARNSSSHPAALRLLRKEFLPGARLSRLWAMCLMVVKLAGACSVRTRHSSSRKTMSRTQWRLFSMAQ